MVHLYKGQENFQESLDLCKELGIDFAVHDKEYSDYYLALEE